MIGTTRKVNPITNTIDFTRMPSSALSLPENQRPKESVIYSLHPELERGKLIFQIGTANPETAVKAAHLFAADVAGIDVNAGCPKPFSTSGGMGAALLKTPDLLCSILEALVKEIGQVYGIGISVKIRILETSELTEVLVRKLVKTGITGLTVHCRTTPMRPRERAIRDQLRMVVGVCHEAGVACLMNGDVESRTQALELMKEFGADGAMIATAAETNSSVFRSAEEGGALDWLVVAKEYVRIALNVDNRWGNTKFLLGQIIPGKSPYYNKMIKCNCYSKVVDVLELGEEAKQLAAAVDERLGIPPGESKAEKRKRQNDARKTVRPSEAAEAERERVEVIKKLKSEAISSVSREFSEGPEVPQAMVNPVSV